MQYEIFAYFTIISSESQDFVIFQYGGPFFPGSETLMSVLAFFIYDFYDCITKLCALNISSQTDLLVSYRSFNYRCFCNTLECYTGETLQHSAREDVY